MSSSRFIATIDSRISDAAGLLFADLHGETHLFQLPNPTATSRRGFRGGCLLGSRLYVCTSSEVHVLEIEWAQGGRPEITPVRVVGRDDWQEGGRAHADLHHLCYDPRQDCLLLANSFNDCIDLLSLEGELLDRQYLREMNPELAQLARTRNPKAADLYHLNHFCAVGDDCILTLANLNGSRKGALMSYRTGEILRRDLCFPHDGLLLTDGTFAIIETEAATLTLFPGVASAADLKTSIARSHPLTSEKLFWPRGLAFINGRLLAGCSRFSEQSIPPSGSDSTHIRVIDRKSLQFSARIDVPALPGFDAPVIYSLLPVGTSLSP